MELLDKFKKESTSNTQSPSPADKLAAMRPDKPLPGRIITHSNHSSHSSDTYVGRPITESDHSLGQTGSSDDE